MYDDGEQFTAGLTARDLEYRLDVARFQVRLGYDLWQWCQSVGLEHQSLALWLALVMGLDREQRKLTALAHVQQVADTYVSQARRLPLIALVLHVLEGENERWGT